MKYGVIRKQDLLADLRSWETLLCSSFMMRPITHLEKDSDVSIAQNNNLRSACALAAILTKDGSPEIDFYKNIVTIPHYQSIGWFQLLEREDPEKVVTDNLEEFRKIFTPVMKKSFEESFTIADGVFSKDPSSSVTRLLLSNVNDNFHQNLYSLSPLKYDADKRFHKKQLSQEEVYDLIDEKVLELPEEDLNKRIHRALDKILLSHRNSKIFLILMSGPFLVGFYIFKYALKILFFYFILKKKKKPDGDSKKDEKEKGDDVPVAAKTTA